MMDDLFNVVAAATTTRERRFLESLAGGHFKPTPRQPVWQWADENVFLGGKMAARAGRYESRRTPWTREPQDLIRQPGVREVAILKCSRSGFTEGFLNCIRWMPKYKPGNVLYAINERNLARQVMKRRIIPTLEESCAEAFEDKNNKSLSVITLQNMDILASGSGSSGPFMEMWYRLIILDELENHLQSQETTTEERAESRQTDVEDGLIVKISKPEAAGGIIDMAYIRGSQKRFWVPCPRCAERIVLERFGVVVPSECRGGDGGYDLNKVVELTYRSCTRCNGRIEEWEKQAMVEEGVWVPTPEKDRRRPPDGRYVPAEPGVESYHMSDWYSLHRRLTTGHLMRMYLMAHEIAPTESRKKYFLTNHEGWPWSNTTYRVDDTSIDALKGGRVEQREVTNTDGTKTVHNEVLGVKFSLCYNTDGLHLARMPFRPAMLSVHADKQKDCIKVLVYAWLSDGQRFLVDMQRFQDEDHMFATLLARPYWVAKDYRADPAQDVPMFVRAGRIDCGYRPTDVFRACLTWHHSHGFQVWPVRGDGDTDKQGGKKLLRFTTDYVEATQITVRVFYDHECKNNFYISRLQERCAPRMWLPDNLPRAIYAEWTSERFVESEGKWVHPDGAAPNDYGDCAKQTEIFWEEESANIRMMDSKAPLPG